MITDDILKDISGALSKKIKKDFTKYKEYSILFLACDVHVRFARVAQWWSTSLPRRGSRVRSPSRALFNFKRKPAFKRLPFLFVFNLFEDNLKTHDSSSCTLLSTVISHTQSLCLKPFPGHHCLQLP